MEIFFWIVILVMVVGAVGTFLPLLPGTPLIVGAALVYAIVDGFQSIGISTLIILGVLTALSLAVDYLAGIWGAKKYGGSRLGVWGAVIGAIAGVFIFGPIGLILGPFLGAAVAEIIAGKKFEDALRVGWGTLVGVLGGGIVKFMIASTMILFFMYDKFSW